MYKITLEIVLKQEDQDINFLAGYLDSVLSQEESYHIDIVDVVELDEDSSIR